MKMHKIYTTLKNDGHWLEAKDKGHVDVYVEIDGHIFALAFEDVYGLRTYSFPENYRLGSHYPLSPTDIIVSKINKKEVKTTIDVLVTDGYFEKI